jgi:microcompartment protein CcmL/EutN
MIKTIGMVEWSSIGLGIESTDCMVKAASVELLDARTVCCGKYIGLVSGDVSAVRTAVTAGSEKHPEAVIDFLVLPNVHPDVIPALFGAVEVPAMPALGVIETFSVAASIKAADKAAKTGQAKLLEIRLAVALGGKGFVLLGGEVSGVQAAVQSGAEVASLEGSLVSAVVIPLLNPQVWEKLF